MPECIHECWHSWPAMVRGHVRSVKTGHGECYKRSWDVKKGHHTQSPGGPKRKQLWQLGKMLLLLLPWQWASPSRQCGLHLLAHRDKCVRRCLCTVCALGCLTTSDSPVVQLSGTPWTQAIRNCQSCKGSKGGVRSGMSRWSLESQPIW